MEGAYATRRCLGLPQGRHNSHQTAPPSVTEFAVIGPSPLTMLLGHVFIIMTTTVAHHMTAIAMQAIQ